MVSKCLIGLTIPNPNQPLPLEDRQKLGKPIEADVR